MYHYRITYQTKDRKIKTEYVLADHGAEAQEIAREALSLCTKSELCMCGFEKDWKHFMDLRLRDKTGKPHPDAQHLASKLWDLFDAKGISL